MKRLPPIGRLEVWLPDTTREDLEKELRALGLSVDSERAASIYRRLNVINGLYYRNYQATVGLPLSVLQSLATNLSRFSKLLGFDTNTGPLQGPKSIPELVLHERLVERLARKPSVGSKDRAEALLNRFRVDAAEIASVCSELHSVCKGERRKDGRHTLDWYDDFAELLKELARQAQVSDSVWIDRASGRKGSWLVAVGLRLETFLLHPMRSKTPHACAKRLERSLNRLRESGSLPTKLANT